MRTGERTLSILDSPYLVEEWGLPTAGILVSGSAPCFIGLDHRSCGRHGEPAVAWFDADLDTELTLAPDFRSFVEGLASARDFESVHAENTRLSSLPNNRSRLNG